MNLVFWRTRRKDQANVEPTRDTDVTRAKERALLAHREATADLKETTERAKWFKDQRAENHFGPAIYEAMRPKR